MPQLCGKDRSKMKEVYDDFVLYWTIPLSVGAVIIGMVVNYFIKDKNE